MKKIVCLLLCVCICLPLAACSNQEGKTETSSVVSLEIRDAENSQVSSMTEESTQESTPQPESESLPRQEPITEAIKYAQVDTYTGEDSAMAYLTLNPNNTFVLAVEFYDGMPEITGSYQLENGTYVMSQLETNTQAIQLSNIKTMKFIQSGENLIYEGDAVEQTVSGAEFRPVEQ